MAPPAVRRVRFAQGFDLARRARREAPTAALLDAPGGALLAHRQGPDARRHPGKGPTP